MKRAILLFGIAFIAFVGFSQNGTEAVNRTFSDRFAAAMPEGASGSYEFDKNHSVVGFKVRHMGLVEIPGYFRDLQGSVKYDAKDVSKSTVEFTAQVTSVDTGVEGRDKHLRSADFFDVEKYPTITFKSTKVEKKGKGWMLTGDFTMKGVTKSITFPFEIAGWLPADKNSGGKMGIAAETTINRRDYGVNFGSTLPGGVAAVSDDIKIVIQIEAGRAKEALEAAPAAAMAD